MDRLHQPLQLLPADEVAVRVAKITAAMPDGVDMLLVNDNVNLFYLTGRVFLGYVLIERDGAIRYFLRRPSVLTGEEVTEIRRPADMLGHVSFEGKTVGLMEDETPYSSLSRLADALGIVNYVNGSGCLRSARAVKTPLEIRLMKECGMRQTEVYRRIPHLYREGMTDIELQVEIERALRLAGCLGQFRCSGSEMEIFMGNVITGENADAPSPYDFAMGGAGLHPSLPVGADGSIICPGKPVMVDMNGNFNGYMTDMTRTFIAGEPSAEIERANSLSRDICAAIADAAVPGAECKALYALADEMVREAGMEPSFMGHTFHAGFVGHGLGITINEPPVLAPRSRDVLQAGNTIALEPKFVIPHVGAVGVENTYVVRPEGSAERITLAPEELVQL
ncbi:MAG: Xaa-Pro peptidase family protein [Muribaculaceae bacterium]|nr:Xaa-Pro peptidase family protein [Muribaculaceae bacterium]